MNDRSSERRAEALALALAAAFALAYILPALVLIAHGAEVRALRVEHGETLSLTTYGRWWILPPHHFITDALSGDLDTFYNFLSDALLNAGSVLTELPPMAFQALIYSPLLAFLFVWGGYRALAVALEDRMTAALAAGIAAFTVNPSLSRLLLGEAAHDALIRLVHVPFHALALGSGQALGWVLFLPATAMLYAARERFTPRRAMAHGILFGLLFLAHTLTFINAAFVGVAYLMVRRWNERPTGWRGGIWTAGTIALVAVFAWRAWVQPPHSFLVLASLWILAMALLFATDTDWRFYLWSYVPAAIVALPYALHLARNARYLAGRDGTVAAVPPFSLLLSFLLQWLLAAAAARWVPRTAGLRWAAVMLGATLFLAENHLWAWGNHPYRFAINLVFPLAILAAYALRHAPRPVAWTLGVALIGAALPWTVATARNQRLLAPLAAVDRESQQFLDSIRRATDAEPDREARMLTPPEFFYPEGIVQSASILGSSSLRGFIPDYRYVLWNERYLNRLALFCFLFRYPHYDMHTGLRACDLSGDPKTFDITDRRIKTEVLPVYDIRYGAALGHPFSGPLADVAQANRWPLLAQAGDFRFHRVGATTLTGVARLSPGTYSSSGFTVAVDVDEPGLQRIVIGGRKLHDRAPSVTIDGREIAVRERNAHWIIGHAELAAGRHELALPRASAQWAEESDFVYFLAVVTEKDSALYFRDRTAP
jgi:hypothetical protein